jgi:hypothetical protein
LQEQFHIPNDHIMGHGEVIGEFSECPGSQFPWEEFHKRLREASGPGLPADTGAAVGGVAVPAGDPRKLLAHRP